ncbi:hypothetical protein BCR39DRAFT_553955 [Naematelia encephala]|uniref:Uncharacterized protein n=1 Tax=Naematelia encephala TaxID=71784 RepID=A0A1Y2AFS5_9TREE|nr:hypothetical protein BCR39DRAFT_553955 [Naematelia encephala]
MDNPLIETLAPPPLIADETPSTEFSSTFDSPDLDASSSIDQALEPLSDLSLTLNDVHADPILANLAKQQLKLNHTAETPEQIKSSQGRPKEGGKVGFRAKPAPASTHKSAESVGPKMTKAAMLRAGLEWTEPIRKSLDGTTGFDNVAGHKRVGLNFNIASLALPKVAPRTTKSSQLRTGQGQGQSGTDSPIKKDIAVVAAENKARDLAERDRRRKSVALPASLSAPQIAPRGNRSSALRLGTGTVVSPFRSPVTKSALTVTSASNVDKTKDKTAVTNDKAKDISIGTKDKGVVNRRASVIGAIRSLGAPSIMPRTNKSAMLRAPGPHVKSASISQPIAPPSLASPKPDLRRTEQTISSAGSVVQSSGPRPTKASLLRAGLGAKVAESQVF